MVDTRPQWKSEEFKNELDEVVNTLRENHGLLHNRYDMKAFAKSYPSSALQGNYCTEYGFRMDTEKYAFLFRCNPTKGDYNFYCYCYVKEWLDRHMEKAAQGFDLLIRITKNCSVFLTEGKLFFIYHGAKLRNVPAALLMNTIQRSTEISITFVNLPSVWKETATLMNPNPRNHHIKPSGIKNMNDKEDR